MRPYRVDLDDGTRITVAWEWVSPRLNDPVQLCIVRRIAGMPNQVMPMALGEVEKFCRDGLLAVKRAPS